LPDIHDARDSHLGHQERLWANVDNNNRFLHPERNSERSAVANFSNKKNC
jgi:hypothetical protein